MKRTEVEAQINDYLDGVLTDAQQAAFEEALPQYPDLQEFVRDATEGLQALQRMEALEPPPELYARIDQQLSLARHQQRQAKRHNGFFASLMSWLGPALQPRLVMGMAMTILSVSMIGQLTGARIDQVTADDLKPSAVWSAIGYRAERTWDRVTKYYESLRVVYEMRTRVQEWKTQIDQERERAAAQLRDPDAEVQEDPDAGRRRPNSSPGNQQPVNQDPE
jgi:hypothetical protein